MIYAVGIFYGVLRDRPRQRGLRPCPSNPHDRPLPSNCANQKQSPACTPKCAAPSDPADRPITANNPSLSFTASSACTPSNAGNPSSSDPPHAGSPSLPSLSIPASNPSSSGPPRSAGTPSPANNPSLTDPPSLHPPAPTQPSAPVHRDLRPGLVLDCAAFEAFQSAWCAKPPGHFRLESRLGRGAFAQVFKAVDNHGRDVALKALDRVAHQSDPFLHCLLQREICNHKQLVHSNVVHVLGMLKTKTSVFLVQELCSGGTLSQYVYDLDRTEQDIKGLVRGMLMGLQHCHSKHIVHGDIKPENVLLASDGSGGWTPKLADWGQSIKLDPACQWRGGGGLIGEEGEDCEVGTAEYAAPEMFECRLCDFKVDIWALGVVVYQLFYEVVPFEDLGRPYASEIRFPMPAIPMSGDAKAFIQALLTEDVHARLSSAQALEHHWLRC